MTDQTTVHTARLRDEDAPDGFRVLCDGLWPRGVRKESAYVDLWAKELSPSKDLRSWYHEDREARHDEFVTRYRKELKDDGHDEVVSQLRQHDSVVLLTDSKDVGASHLPVLQEWVRAAL